MRRKYKVLTVLILIELMIASSLEKYDFKIQTWFGNFIGAIVFLTPIQILLFLLSRDEKKSKIKKVCFKFLFWHINICFVAGAIATLILGN